MDSVARINRLFGVGGEVMITLYPTFPEDFDLNDPLFAKVDGLNVPLYLEKFERRGKAGAVVAFADIDTERRVTEFLNTELYLPDNEAAEGDYFSADDEFTFMDLIGFTVDATVGDGIVYGGEVTEFYDTKNPLFEVTFDGGREVLIPAAEEFIAGIDFEERHIVFLLPEGLLEL
ncbi:MAG: ribosome maturation factor RimM [Rikenellaceae bacterium]